MSMKRPKDCPKKGRSCSIEGTRACLILTKLRKDGHGCCDDNAECAAKEQYRHDGGTYIGCGEQEEIDCCN